MSEELTAESIITATNLEPILPGEVTAVGLAEVAEPNPELTEEQQAAQAASDLSFNTLKKYIEDAVDGMYKLDVELGFIEVEADTLFKNYRRIKASKTKEFNTFLEEKNAAETKFYSLKVSTLTEVAYDAPTKVEEEVSAESIQ